MNIIIYLCIGFSFFGIGRLISKCDLPLFKKIMYKRHEKASDRMVNNYYGNMISVAGIIVCVFMIMGINCMESYVIAAICLLCAYVIHISDATGNSIDNAITYILDINNKSVKQYLSGTVCSILAIMAAGAIGCYIISPLIFTENKKTQSEDVSYKLDINETTRQKEEEFMNVLDNAFN